MDQIANHPIPQDVTGFKFRLIGSITIKQFLYLLAAGGIGVVIWLLPVPFYVKIPFLMVIGGVGMGMAFIPVEGRPMDIMIVNFVKALPSENRYIYRKRGANFFAYEFKKAAPPKQNTERTDDQIKKSIIISQLRNSSYRPDKKEIDFMNSIRNFFDETAFTKVVQTTAPPVAAPVTTPPPPPPTQPAPMMQAEVVRPSDQDIARELGQQALELQKQIKQTQIEEKESKKGEEMQQKLLDLQSQLEKVLSQRDSLEKKLVAYESQHAVQKTYAPSDSKEPEKTQSVRRVDTAQSQLKAGFPMLPDAPNVILGIVKDPRDKVLPGILVEVVDNDNVPVRAFKTNALGQFASATSLPNGTYKVFFEDPKKQHEFDTIEINLKGEVFHPLEVFSVDSREKLRRELFAN